MQCKSMQYKTVKGIMVGNYIVSDNIHYYLTHPFKTELYSGYFLLMKTNGEPYTLIKQLILNKKK